MTNVWVRLHPDQEKYWGDAAVVKFENAEFCLYDGGPGSPADMMVLEQGNPRHNLAFFHMTTYLGVTTVEAVAKMWTLVPVASRDVYNSVLGAFDRACDRATAVGLDLRDAQHSGVAAAMVEHRKLLGAAQVQKEFTPEPSAVAQHLDPANSGHGHVRPRPDGVRARCGGPAICAVCQREQAREDDHVRKMQGYEPLAEGEIVEANQRELERNERLATEADSER